MDVMFLPQHNVVIMIMGDVHFGNSMIIDPWGTILKRAKHSIGSISCNIDLEKVNFYRKRIPAMTEY